MLYKDTIITYNKILDALDKYKDKNAFFICDSNVDSDSIMSKFNSFRSFSLNASEDSKSIYTALEILGLLCEYNFSKDDLIIAVGGGVTLDVAGFVAANYKRGINLVLVPTSLLAMVDASIGGKCALNFKGYKNVLGTFYDPLEVIIDPSFLKTLPDVEYKNGMIELIKMGLTIDYEIIDAINKEDINRSIAKAVDAKKNIVLTDYFDKKERHVLNFGHTLGHAIELLNPTFKHGFCVGCGMLFFTEDEDLRNTLYEEFKKLYDIDEYLDFIKNNRNEVLDNILQDKKVKMGVPSVVVLDGICKYSLKEMTLEEIDARIRRYFNV